MWKGKDFFPRSLRKLFLCSLANTCVCLLSKSLLPGLFLASPYICSLTIFVAVRSVTIPTFIKVDEAILTVFCLGNTQ